jgi:PleD family two-component response regulator
VSGRGEPKGDMSKRKRFGEILVEAGALDQEALDKALSQQKSTGKRLGQILEESGIIAERDIAMVVARQFGLKSVSKIAQHPFPAATLTLIDSETALKKLVFPLKVEEKVLSLAMVNPLDIPTLDDISFRTGLRIMPYVTTPSEIIEAVNHHYLKSGQAGDKEWWTVLVVDDQEMVRAAIAAALKKEGFIVIQASNGAEGLKEALQNPPHLIISDTVMPRMDGLEMFRALQTQITTRDIPVIALSSRAAAEEEAHLLEMGYFDFIAKPINPIRLVARTKRALRAVYGPDPRRATP